MKLSKDELLEKVKSEHESPTEEGYISLLEDISDSMVDVNEELTNTIEKLTQELADMKQKYIDRFFTSEEPEEETTEEETTEEETTIDDLFEEDTEYKGE